MTWKKLFFSNERLNKTNYVLLLIFDYVSLQMAPHIKIHFLNESLPFIQFFKHCYCTSGINGKGKLFYWHIFTIILYLCATHFWKKLAIFGSKVTSGVFLTIDVGALIGLNRGPDLEINSSIMYRGWGWQELSQHCLIYYKPLWAQIVRRPEW